MDLAHELTDLVRTLTQWAEKVLRPEGLNYNQYVALHIITNRPGITGRALAESLHVTEAGGSGIVRALLESELIANQAGTGSGNRRELHITGVGAAKRDECGRLLGGSLDDNARTIGLDPQELAGTIRALHDEVRTIRHPNPGAPQSGRHADHRPAPRRPAPDHSSHSKENLL